MPTPSVSRAHSRVMKVILMIGLDGIVVPHPITPWIMGCNKYNAATNEVAFLDTLITKWIETRANEYVHAYCELEGF